MTSPSKKRGKMSGEHLARDNPRLYGVWCNMKTRCYNPNVDCYRLYGGKGVKICEEWQEFKPFCLWALANGYVSVVHVQVDMTAYHQMEQLKKLL